MQNPNHSPPDGRGIAVRRVGTGLLLLASVALALASVPAGMALLVIGEISLRILGGGHV